MLFNESYRQLRKQSLFHLRFFFSYSDDFFSPTVRVKCYYISYLHLRLFALETLISFHFLNFVFISHAIRHQCKRHVLFWKGELFVFFNFCICIATLVSFFMNELTLWDKRLEIPTRILYKYLHLGSTEQFYTSFSCRMWFFLLDLCPSNFSTTQRNQIYVMHRQPKFQLWDDNLAQ